MKIYIIEIIVYEIVVKYLLLSYDDRVIEKCKPYYLLSDYCFTLLRQMQ